MSKKVSRKKLEELQDKFMQQYDVFAFGNSCGIGAPSSDTSSLGVGLMLGFQTKAQMDAFPHKEDTYEGVPVYKRVTGVIRAL